MRRYDPHIFEIIDDGWPPLPRRQRRGRTVKRSLDGVAVFTRLPPARRSAIAGECLWRKVKVGASIVAVEDRSCAVFFLTAGRAQSLIYAASGAVVAFGDITAGTMFGEIAAIDGLPRMVAVEAVDECIIASLGGARFLELTRSEPDFGAAVLLQVALNVRRLTGRIFEYSTMPVGHRVQAELLRLAGGTPRNGRDARIEAVPTHAALAARISTHREAVTRELNRLSRLGLVRRTKGALVVTDVERLRQMLSEDEPAD